MFESISLSKNALEYLGCTTLFHPVMGGAGDVMDRALDELQANKMMVKVGEVADYFGKICPTYELTALGKTYMGWLEGHKLINNGCCLDEGWMKRYKAVSGKNQKCNHNWVMDGHNAGDPICSKCYSREV